LKQDYISILDIFIAIVWFVILYAIVSSRANKQKEEIRRYYSSNFLSKVFFAITFTLFYIFYYGGGDTVAYWDGAVVLNKLAFNSPSSFIEALTNESSDLFRSKHFNINTGFPPGWIYREQEGWFVCKITSFFSLITFRSYLAAVIIFGYFVSDATWKIFEIISKLKLHNIRTAAFCMFFVPSVGFWCSGISKDTIIYISILNILHSVLDVFINKKKINIGLVLRIIFFAWIILQIRSFVIAAILLPLLTAFSARFIKNYSSSGFVRFFLRTIFFAIGFVGFFLFTSSGFIKEMADKASVIQTDFKNNPLYTGKRYEIDVSDPSATGMMRAFPISVFYGIYKPLIYEALSPTLILNGLESTVLVFLTVSFFLRGNVFKKIRYIQQSEFLVFAFVFVILIGFMAGYTSVIYGVLVRIRAPLLPFLFLIFTTKSQQEENNEVLNQPQLN